MNENTKKYTDLDVWKESRELNILVYSQLDKFPINEQFALTSQIKRCSISISSNIAEGCGRNTNKDTLHFLYIARGSTYELESQFYLAFDLKYISENELKVILEKIEKCLKLLNGFIRYYKSKI